MYSKSAPYYDAIYSFKNYRKESQRLHEIIQGAKGSAGKRLLDVACGSGNHVMHLKQHYNVEGLDITPRLLKIARKKNPEITFHRGDMCTFRLNQRYDVITCLFSAIGHVKTLARMGKAVRNMSRHLQPGGLLILEPWFSPDQWSVGHMSANFVDQPNLKVARLSISKRRQHLSVNDLHHLVATPRGIEYFVERLELGLFTLEDYLGAFQSAGLKVRRDKHGLIGRGLYIGLKPVT